MTVDDALKLARDCGVRVTLDGNDLALEADAPPPPRLLAVIGRGKWDIVAVLRQREAEERRRIIQWVADHFTSSPAGVCAHCGGERATRRPIRSALCRKRPRRSARLLSPVVAGRARG